MSFKIPRGGFKLDEKSFSLDLNGVLSVSGGGSDGGVQPDWNQNDETAADYVKNRPFYTGDPVETVLVEESTVWFADEGGLYTAQLKSTFVPTVGETYKVSWDGTTYECACIDLSGDKAIGNLSIISEGSDTGEPFLVVVPNGEGIRIATVDTSATHTFSISGIVAPIVKIPAKYIDKNSSGYIVIHSKDTMTKQEAENYRTAISTKEVVFIIWKGICIKSISFGESDGVYGMTLRTINGETYSIAQKGDGLFSLGDRKFSNLTFPGNIASGNACTEIWFYENEIKIIPGSSSSGVGSTDTLFRVEPDGIKSKAFEVLGNGEAVAPALILYSSTAGSTKKFRITVDDSGALTATEVI